MSTPPKAALAKAATRAVNRAEIIDANFLQFLDTWPEAFRAGDVDAPVREGLPLTGRDALGQVIGFLVFENGLFALAVLATYGLPGIVEAGAFLEVLVLVLLMEGMLIQIRREHDSLDVDRLRELRG